MGLLHCIKNKDKNSQSYTKKNHIKMVYKLKTNNQCRHEKIVKARFKQ